MTQPTPDPNRGIRTAGTVAIWVWIAGAVVPLALMILCMGLCVVGAAMPSTR